MKKKKLSPYPGSLYADYGKWVVKIKGKKYHTGYDATKSTLLIAKEFHRITWLEIIGGKTINNKMQIKDCWNEFKKYKSNKMEKTLINYELSFRRIVTENYIIDLKRIELDILKLLRDDRLSNISKADYLRQFYIFLNWCYRNKYIDDPRYLRELMPKYTITPQSWKKEEIEKLTEYFCITDPEMSILIMLMLNTGARMTDALHLEWKDIKGNLIIWKNKITKNEEPRPISNYVQQLIKLLKNENKLFRWTINGSSYLNKILRDASHELKIDRNKRSFQEFRVTFRMRLKQKGMREEDIKYLLRHSQTGTTEKYYTEFYNNELIETLNKIGKII
jgi:integrase